MTSKNQPIIVSASDSKCGVQKMFRLIQYVVTISLVVVLFGGCNNFRQVSSDAVSQPVFEEVEIPADIGVYLASLGKDVEIYRWKNGLVSGYVQFEIDGQADQKIPIDLQQFNQEINPDGKFKAENFSGIVVIERPNSGAWATEPWRVVVRVRLTQDKGATIQQQQTFSGLLKFPTEKGDDINIVRYAPFFGGNTLKMSYVPDGKVVGKNWLELNVVAPNNLATEK